MKVEVETLRASLKRLHIEIPAERIHEKLATSFETIQKSAQIPGFRRSRAPMAVVRARYGDAVRRDVINELVPEVCQQAVDDNGLVVVGDAVLNPSLDQMKIADGEGLAFLLDVDVKPEIVVPDLTGLEVDKRPADVTSEDVETYLTALRENRAEFQELETPRPVALEDALYADWAERVADTDEVVFERESALVEPAKMASDGPYAIVRDAIVGMSVGETKTISVTLPANPSDESSSERVSNVTVTVKRIGTRIAPELDDAFARSMNYEDVAQLRAGTWNALIEKAKGEKREAQRRDLLEQLVAKSSFDVPLALIARQQRELLLSTLANRRRYGVETSSEQIEEIFNGYREDAEKMIRRDWLYDEIAAANNIEVSDDELIAHIHNQARATGQDPEKFEARIRAADQLENARDELRSERILDLLIEKADEKRQLIY